MFVNDKINSAQASGRLSENQLRALVHSSAADLDRLGRPFRRELHRDALADAVDDDEDRAVGGVMRGWRALFSRHNSAFLRRSRQYEA